MLSSSNRLLHLVLPGQGAAHPRRCQAS
jgi:hypothetical protein